jgi:hypothetical protein
MDKLSNAFLMVLIFQIFIIISFSLLYLSLKHQFIQNKGQLDNSKPDISYYDCLLLSSTIQAGVGVYTIFPDSSASKILVTIQQWVTILTGLYVLLTFKQIVMK